MSAMITTTTTEYTYTSVTAVIARLAGNLSEDFDLPLEETVDRLAGRMIDNATDARTRGGQWARESTTEQIDEVLFYGTVALDVLDGDVERPSVGNVREHTLRLARRGMASGLDC